MLSRTARNKMMWRPLTASHVTTVADAPGKQCDHMRHPRACRLCATGMTFCPHGKQPSRCVPCGGNHANDRPPARCEHNRRKYDCLRCAGERRWCLHSACRYKCLLCTCRHKFPRGECDQCNLLCSHGHRRSSCRTCNTAAALCRHRTTRHLCLVCRSLSGCRHGRIRSKCTQCAGIRATMQHDASTARSARRSRCALTCGSDPSAGSVASGVHTGFCAWNAFCVVAAARVLTTSAVASARTVFRRRAIRTCLSELAWVAKP